MAVDHELYNSGGVSAEFYGWTAKTASIGTSIRQIPNTFNILILEEKIQNQVTTCSDFPSDALLWIKEVEMVESLEELKSSRSVCGRIFQISRCWTRRVASALNEIIQNSQVKKKFSLEEQKAQKEDQFLRGRQIAFCDLRLLSSYWCSWHSSRVRWFILCHSSWR